MKVYGNIRVFKEEKAIVGTHIKKIEKYDELTNHFLAVYVSHCIRKKGILKPKDLNINAPVQEASQGGFQNRNEGGGGGYQNRNNGGYGGGGGHQQQNNNHHSDQSFQPKKAILEVMKQITKTQKFVNKQHLYSLIRDKIDMGNFEREMNNMM